MDAMKDKGTVANNAPVGSAGQPFGNLKKEVPDARRNAISKRLKKMKDTGKK
jgi:hypothetical protein